MYNSSMKQTILQYNILVEKEEQKRGQSFYVAYAPTLGISDFGKTADQAAKNIEGAIKIYLETLQDVGQEIPRPDSTEFYVTSRKIALDTPISSFT